VDNVSTRQVDLSVIIPITERYDPVPELFYEYKSAIDATGMRYELVYVLDGSYPEALEDLKKLKETEQLTIIQLAKCFGEATALSAAFNNTHGDILLTLPAYHQIEADEIPNLIKPLADNDMVLARRWPRKDSWFNRLQSGIFNFLLRPVSDLKIRDAGCGARAFKRSVVEEVPIYGDLHRFFPVMAHRQGFRVAEIDAAQSPKDTHRRIYAPGIYVRRLLDLLTIFFLAKFTKKPLRFFGLVGTSLAGIGVATTLVLVAQRLWFDVALANRPALFLSSLLIVLGIQIIAIGLIGEIIIFTHARDLKEYKVEKIIN